MSCFKKVNLAAFMLVSALVKVIRNLVDFALELIGIIDISIKRSLIVIIATTRVQCTFARM
jgi:hypothetical protein